MNKKPDPIAEHEAEAPVDGLPPRALAGAPGAPVQWGSRTLTGPSKVQLALTKPGSPREVLAEVICGPGYVEMLGEPVTLPPIPPGPPALCLFSIPASAIQGTSILALVELTSNVTAPAGVIVTGLGAAVTITVPVGQRKGQASLAVPASQAPGPVTLTATYGGKAMTAVLQVQTVPPIPVPIPPGPDPPTPSPEGTLGYVAVDGKANATGTQADPWSIMDALTGKLAAKLAVGGTVWLLPGTYKAPQLDPEGVGYLMTVSGNPQKPLLFRAMPGARAIIDGGLAWWGSSHHVWLQDLEFIVTEAKPTGTSGSNPSPAGSPRGGIHVYSGGVGNKAINCILGAMADKVGFGNRQGASIWLPSRDFELYGCLIVDNGWQGTDRGHGHGAYIQNPPGSYRKFARENIFQHRNTLNVQSGRYQFHIYGESPQLANVTAEGNVVIGNCPSLFSDGASSAPSAGHEIINNVFAGAGFQVASSSIAPARVLNNTLFNGSIQIVGDGGGQVLDGNVVVPPAAKPPTAATLLHSNTYDPNRSHLIVIDWPKAGKVQTAPPGLVGQNVRIMDPTDFWGPPIFSGIVPSAGISLPVGSFGAAAFVVLKG